MSYYGGYDSDQDTPWVKQINCGLLPPDYGPDGRSPWFIEYWAGIAGLIALVSVVLRLTKFFLNLIDQAKNRGFASLTTNWHHKLVTVALLTTCIGIAVPVMKNGSCCSWKSSDDCRGIVISLVILWLLFSGTEYLLWTYFAPMDVAANNTEPQNDREMVEQGGQVNSADRVPEPAEDSTDRLPRDVPHPAGVADPATAPAVPGYPTSSGALGMPTGIIPMPGAHFTHGYYQRG